MEDQAEEFMGSLETVLISFIHSLLSRSQSRGPTELKMCLGNVVFLNTQERNDIALLNT